MFNFLKLHLMYVFVYTFYQKLKMQPNVYISVKIRFLMIVRIGKPILINANTQITFILVKIHFILKMFKNTCKKNQEIRKKRIPIQSTSNCYSIVYLQFFSQTADWRSSRVYPQNVGRNSRSILCSDTERPENLKGNNDFM